jgi:hypothetical protein
MLTFLVPEAVRRKAALYCDRASPASRKSAKLLERREQIESAQAGLLSEVERRRAEDDFEVRVGALRHLPLSTQPVPSRLVGLKTGVDLVLDHQRETAPVVPQEDDLQVGFAEVVALRDPAFSNDRRPPGELGQGLNMVRKLGIHFELFGEQEITSRSVLLPPASFTLLENPRFNWVFRKHFSYLGEAADSNIGRATRRRPIFWVT